MPRPDPPAFAGEWYSVCSAHREYTPDCRNCNSGRWVSHAEHEMSQWLWKYSPQIWRKWANRKPDLMLEEIFPNLKGHHVSQLPAEETPSSLNTKFQKWLDGLQNPWRPILIALMFLLPLWLLGSGWTSSLIKITGLALLLAVAVSRYAYLKNAPVA